MTNGLLVVSGTHGVAKARWDSRSYYKCCVGSNPTRSAIHEVILLGGLTLFIPPVAIPRCNLRMAALAYLLTQDPLIP